MSEQNQTPAQPIEGPSAAQKLKAAFNKETAKQVAYDVAVTTAALVAADLVVKGGKKLVKHQLDKRAAKSANAVSDSESTNVASIDAAKKIVVK